MGVSFDSTGALGWICTFGSASAVSEFKSAGLIYPLIAESATVAGEAR